MHALIPIFEWDVKYVYEFGNDYRASIYKKGVTNKLESSDTAWIPWKSYWLIVAIESSYMWAINKAEYFETKC